MNELLKNAFNFALMVHQNHFRKDGQPYIVHPFSVAVILAKNGASDMLIAAGLLHDTLEDAAISPEQIRTLFGEEILRYILFDTENKTLSWQQRKLATIDALKNCDREYTMLVCADKLSNITDILSDMEKSGEAVWNKFKYDKEKQKWLFKEYINAFEKISDLQMYRDYIETFDKVFNEKVHKVYAY